MNRQKRILFILFGVLILSLLYALWRTPRQERAGEGRPPTSLSTSAPAPSSSSFRVQLELLERSQAPFPGARRDIFGPLYRVKPPAPPPVPVVVLPPPPVEVPPPVMESALRELARFTFLGFLEKDQEKTVFLSSGDDIFVVKKGERLGPNQEYRVIELSSDRLVLELRDDPRKITVPLVEQAPLSPMMMRMPSSTTPSSAPGGFNRSYPGGRMPVPPMPEVDSEIAPDGGNSDLQQPVTGDEEYPEEEVIQ